MKYKETNGNEKKAGTIALEKLNVMQLLESKYLYEIAKDFGVSKTTVHNIATAQLKSRSIGSSIDENEFAKEDYHNSQGAWMNSSERVAYTHFKNI